MSTTQPTPPPAIPGSGSTAKTIGKAPTGALAAALVRRPGWLVRTGLATITLVVYLPSAFRLGWYYDDWSIYAQQRDVSGGFLRHLDACSSSVAGGRTLACLYHVSEYAILGSHRSLYHLVVIGFLILIAWLAYSILIRCRIAWGWAALISALMVVSPASDSTRLWPVAAIGLYVVALQLTAVLVAVVALRRGWSKLSLVVHVVAAALSLLAMATYEIAVPLVLLNVLIYLAAAPRRPALRRGALDVGLVASFLLYRVTIAPVDPASGLNVHRSISATIIRAGLLIREMWRTWHSLYAPGWFGSVAVGIVVVSAVTLAATDVRSRRRLLPWAALVLAATTMAVACALAFLTANDLYVPTVDGTFNRLNLPATLAYAAAFVALLGLAYEVLRRVARQRWLALAVLTAGVVAVSVHELQVSSTHNRAWEASWQQQTAALAAYRPALAHLIPSSRILGFDTPIWEQGFVPVFAASWDLRGALDYTTHIDYPRVIPDVPGQVSCGPTGILVGGAPFTPYLRPGEPLYAVSPRRGLAVPIDSQSSCDQITARWGQNPFWGATGPG